MGRTVLSLAALWLIFSGSVAMNSFVFKDNVGAESAARLYRQTPGAVYASAAPYGAYSFQIPTYISTQKTAASKIIPVKESIQNAYLRDSYGNRFVEALQSMKQFPLKPFPQQYVQLQELPAHFTQPLAAAPLNYQQYKPPQASSTQQIIVGSHYRLPVVHSAQPTQSNQYSYAQSHPSAYAGGVRNLAPSTFLNSYGSQLGPVIQLPVRSAGPSQDAHKVIPTVQSYSHSVSESHEPPSAQQQSSSHKAIYANTQPQEHYYHLSGEHKFQRLQEPPQDASYEEEEQEEESPAPVRHVVHKEKVQLKTAAIRDTPIPTIVNGKKTVVNVETKPPIPLLDISLLEPLTFANPLVPQVQHFLPRIAEATYHKLPIQNDQKKYQKEFVVQKTKSYDSGVIKGKPKKVAPKKNIENLYDDVYVPQATARPTVAVQAPDDAPEISYEINSPNYKETYKEKAVKYNKETNSEPVHYTYGTKSHKEPVHYSYTHSSKEPVTIQEVRYEGKGEAPKHLIHKFKSDENKDTGKIESDEDSGESHNLSDDEAPQHPHLHHTEHHSNGQSKPSHHHEAEHREQEYHHKPSYTEHNHYHKPAEHSHHEAHSGKHGQPHHSLNDVPFQKVAEYEEDISLTAPIRVDPNQHVQRPQAPQSPRSSDIPQQHSHHQHSPASHHSTKNSNPHHDAPSTHVQEKTKQVYIQEETPDDDDSVGEHFMKSMFGKEEDKEKDFEKAYQNAAFGFPAYSKSNDDIEKDIYNPESYGVSRDHTTYDIDHTPFQQYHEGDNYPKETRLSYKDNRDKTKEDYFLDYSVSKPESLLDRYKNKVDYYKLYKNQKPEKYVFHDDSKKKQSEKLTTAPISYSYFPIPEDKMKQFFAQYNAAPIMFEYDYSKGLQKDNTAHASRPFQSLKMKTHFVEPQFQYGFEPISLPRLLDSELAAMATNNSPESEKPGTRKKIYKENFYIKKTSTDARPNS